MAEMMAFSAQPHESIDTVLNRFQVLKSRAGDHGLNPGPSGWAWMLLTGLKIGPEEWLTLLNVAKSRFPENDREFAALLQSIVDVGASTRRTGS